MKVVLKDAMFDRIWKDLSEAHRAGRLPDYIVVSSEEYRELASDPRIWGHMESSFARMCATPKEPCEATHKVWSFVGRTATRRPIQVASHETFQGVPLVVVPVEYLPR